MPQSLFTAPIPLPPPSFLPQTSMLKQLDGADPVRLALTAALLEKLHAMGVNPSAKVANK